MATAQYNLPPVLRPREKLIRDPGASSLSEAELLAILLNMGTVGCPVVELAHRMLAAFPSLDEFVDADWLAMKTRLAEWNEKNPGHPVKGVADAKLLRIAAAFQLVRRAQSRISVEEFRKTDVGSAEAAAKLFRRILATAPEKEHFFVLPVNGSLHPLCEPIDVSQGSVSRTPVHPRDVFCEAVRYRAFAVLVAHNHPSGKPEPSAEDLDVTRTLAETGRLLKVKLLDHLVLGAPGSAGGKGYLSIRALRPDLFAQSAGRNPTGPERP
ncbi:MAG: DNA repair protein RadC [Kiritimatiellae bacterium]|nr:DNA repair protein RadC [Kiritimatiellia bacterium]